MEQTAFTPAELETYRRLAKITMVEMAQHMRLSTRAYQELASGRTHPRLMHRRLAEMALLAVARKTDDISILPPHLRDMVRDVHALIEAEERKA